LPVVEIFHLLGVNTSLDENDGSVKVTMYGNGESEFHIKNGEPLFPVADRDWSMLFHHDIMPMLVEDTLFISHSDFRRIFIFHGANVFVDRRSSRLNITVWDS